MFLNQQDLASQDQSIIEPENIPNQDADIINFEDDIASKKNVKEFNSQRSFKDFAEEQKQQIASKQRIYFDSPTKFAKNTQFFKEEEQDFSQYGQESVHESQFDYQINSRVPQVIKQESEENKSPSNEDVIEFCIIDQLQFPEKEVFQEQQQQKENLKQTKKNHPLTQKIWSCNGIPNVRQFLFSPVPTGFTMQFKIIRDKSGMARLYPKYHLVLADKDIYLATAKMLAFQKTSKYIFTLKKEDTTTKNKLNYIARLRSNFMGTEFMLYDNGLSPEDARHPDQVRCQLCLIKYESNLLQTRCPKKITVLTPTLIENQIASIKPLNKLEGLLKKEKLGLYYEYNSKQPQWNHKIQGYVLNFNERVNKPSIKNFQLIRLGGASEQVVLQFGKYNEDGFNLDIKYPFTPLQAFGICVSNFDYKFACE